MGLAIKDTRKLQLRSEVKGGGEAERGGRERITGVQSMGQGGGRGDKHMSAPQ